MSYCSIVRKGLNLPEIEEKQVKYKDCYTDDDNNLFFQQHKNTLPLVRTKVCKNITIHGKCTYKECMFAHNLEEFVLPNCIFDNSCKNLNSDPNCKFKHSCETIEEFYTRTKQSPPNFLKQSTLSYLPRLRVKK